MISPPYTECTVSVSFESDSDITVCILNLSLMYCIAVFSSSDIIACTPFLALCSTYAHTVYMMSVELPTHEHTGRDTGNVYSIRGGFTHSIYSIYSTLHSGIGGVYSGEKN